MYKIEKMPTSIELGYTGEKGFRKIEIDMSKWMKTMPAGVPSIVHIRPGETMADAYVAVTNFTNNILTWEITAADLGSNGGEGIAQIWLEEEENDSVVKRGKSTMVKTEVHHAINDASETVPEVQEAFLEQVTALKVATINAKNATESILAKPYSPLKTYNIGDHVIQEDKYYESLTNIDEPEAWTEGHWKEIDIGVELKELNTILGVEKTPIPLKNLNVTPYESETYKNVRFTINDDNSISLANAPSANIYWPDSSDTSLRWPLPAGTYTLSGGTDIDNWRQVVLQLFEEKTSVSNFEIHSIGSYGDKTETFTVEEDCWAVITLTIDGRSSDLTGYTIRPQLEAGTTATAYESPWQRYEVSSDLDNKLDKNQGSENAGKIFAVGNDGNAAVIDLPTDDTLLETGVPADAKTTGDAIGEINGKILKSIPLTSVVSGKYINANGAEVSSSSYTCTGYIDWDYNVLSKLIFTGTIYDSVGCAFYDKRKNKILAITGANAGTYGIVAERVVKKIAVPVPENTKYVRLSYYGAASTASFNVQTTFVGYIENEDPAAAMIDKIIRSIAVSSVVSGKYINSSGTENSSNSYSCTDYVKWEYNGQSVVSFFGIIYDSAGCAFYDEEKKCVLSVTGANASQYGATSERANREIVLPVPKGTKYIRLSYLGTAAVTSFEIKTIYNGYMEKVPEQFLQGKDATICSTTFTSYKVLADGEPADSTYGSRIISDFIEVEAEKYYMITASAYGTNDIYVFYDSSYNVVYEKKAVSGQTVPIVNDLVMIPEGVSYIRIAAITNVTGAVVGKCGGVELKRKPEDKWTERFLNIGYSDIDMAKINTSEHYRTVCHYGFNVCKGDVEITSDDELVMCHDSGFTFDGNGRIVSFDENNNTPIVSMTLEACLEKEYANDMYMGHRAKVCDIDGFLKVCEEFNVTAFITVRSTNYETVAQKTLEKLKEHNFTNNSMINSYDIKTLSVVHMLNPDIPCSWVLGTNQMPNGAQIETAKQFGNMAFTLTSTDEGLETFVTSGMETIREINADGIGLMYAQVQSVENLIYVRDNGFGGAQIGRPILPYNFSDISFKVTVSSGSASLSWWKAQNLFTATISVSENVITISDFKKQGSSSGYNDEIMECWMNLMPYRIAVESSARQNAYAKWEDNALKITVEDAQTYDIISVFINV